MAGHPWNTITHKTPDTPERRAAQAATVERLAAESDAYERSLGELRRARSFTQATLAQTLGVSQAQVSRIENQSDLYLSTLNSYVEAMGGHLRLVGVFEGGTEVVLGLGDLAEPAAVVPVVARAQH